MCSDPPPPATDAASAQDSEERTAELRRCVEDLRSRRDAAFARSRVQSGDGARLWRQVGRAQEAHEIAARRIQHLQLASARLRSEVAETDAARSHLESELAELQPLVLRLRRLEDCEDVLIDRRRRRLLQRMLLRWQTVFRTTARSERAGALGARGMSSHETRLLRSCVTVWRRCVASEPAAATEEAERRRVCVDGEAAVESQRAFAARAAGWRGRQGARRLCLSAFRGWLGVLAFRAHTRRYVSVARRLFNRRQLMCLLREWRFASASRRRRYRLLELQSARRRGSLLKKGLWRLLREAVHQRRVRVGFERCAMAHYRRVCQLNFRAWCCFVAARRPTTRLVREMEQERTPISSRRMLMKCLSALRRHAAQARATTERLRVARRREHISLLSWVLESLRAVSYRQRCMAEHSDEVRRRGRLRGLAAWTLWLRSRRRLDHNAMVEARHRGSRSSAAAGRAILRWRGRMLRRRMLADRLATGTRRRELRLLRSALRAWIEAVRESLRSQCSALDLRIEDARLLARSREEERASSEATLREAELARGDLEAQIRCKALPRFVSSSPPLLASSRRATPRPTSHHATLHHVTPAYTSLP